LREREGERRVSGQVGEIEIHRNKKTERQRWQ
jgi:hypothetical protein